MFSWLTGSPKLRTRLQKTLIGSRVIYSRNGNGNGHHAAAGPDITVYLLLSIMVLLIFLCVAVLAFFYFWQTGEGAERNTAVSTDPTAFPEVPDVIEVVVIATPTMSVTLGVPTAVPTPILSPMTCADIQHSDPTAADGEYTLYLNRNQAYPATIYCHNMAGSPIEYLTLNSTGDNANFASTAYPNDELITRYAKLRIDLHNLVLDPTDRTFATISGTVPPYSRVPYNDYGRAVGCNESQPGAAFGRANIDLIGTAFALDSTIAFTLAGADAEGSGAQMSENGQTVNLQAGGRCGWVAPDGPLQLVYVP